MIKEITTPLSHETVKSLNAGDEVYISGELYTARDAAHKRMVEALQRGEELPFNLNNAIIYYTGPTPAPEGLAIGSAGPTTSYRMDAYTPFLLEKTGLSAAIGKGDRNNDVGKALQQYTSCYFAAIGGAAALIASCIISSKVIAYDDLGPEAVRLIRVVKFPAVVARDCFGQSVYSF